MSGLSTHVLDLTHGRPAAGVPVRLLQGEAVLFAGETNPDGRCPALGEGERLAKGHYALEFTIAGYFRAKGLTLSDPPFLDRITIAFAIADPASHHHVPLLVSPYGYSTYRGS